MQNDPGHLDIDAVSAYVDRDLHVDDLATIAFHLSNCPACYREVLEIRTTILLLATLPQYEPRRSFCLGQEHARASRRREESPKTQTWSGANVLIGQAGEPVAGPAGASRGGGWLSGLHVAAVVVGTLLLLVTAGDLTGFIDDPTSPMQLAAPTAAAGLPEPPQAAMPAVEAPQAAQEAPAPAAEVASEPESASDAAPSGRVSAFQDVPVESGGGTVDRDSASEEMPEAENLARTAPRATVVGAAAVTQAIPTPGAESAPAGGRTAESVPASESAASEEQPSRMLIVQIALGVLLAWLIVSIVGMRWVRRLR